MAGIMNQTPATPTWPRPLVDWYGLDQDHPTLHLTFAKDLMPSSQQVRQELRRAFREQKTVTFAKKAKRGFTIYSNNGYVCICVSCDRVVTK